MLDAIERLIDKKIPKADAPDIPKPEPREKPKRERRKKAEVAEDTPESKPAANDDKPRGRSRDRGQREKSPVVGMGDHMPSFIAMSFEERKAS